MICSTPCTPRKASVWPQTQVDIHQRIIVIDVSENREEQLVLINPEMLEKDGETGIEEGCLSIPEQRALVPRAEKVKIRALDRNGKPFELEAGWPAGYLYPA
ncbi:peptide deformylase [Klebsiella pneumoniae]|uniref:Peptide deformylase n=1 Tax=Klebsiella pneumoniae TaxID=573 RepID=A0A377YQU5_KLEPN|nr:peptide deformylase [Klebsiella pneumoniae]